MTAMQGKFILASTPTSVFTLSAAISALSTWSYFISSLLHQGGVLLFLSYLSYSNVASIYCCFIPFVTLFLSFTSFLACQPAPQSYQTGFPFEAIAARFPARLCSISQENLWQKSDTEFWSRCGRLHWRDVLEWNLAGGFKQVLIQIRAQEGVLTLPFFWKISCAHSLLLKLLSLSLKSYQRNKKSWQRKDTKHRTVTEVTDWRCGTNIYPFGNVQYAEF